MTTALMAKEVGGIEALEQRLDEWERTPRPTVDTNGKRPKMKPARTAMSSEKAAAMLRELQSEDSTLKRGR